MTRILALSLLLAAASCDAPADPQWRYGVHLPSVEFSLYSTSMGVHPDRSVLDDPNNPFRNDPVGADTKWDIADGGGDPAAFYAWATVLAREPTGEHQFYTALLLWSLADRGLVAEGLESIVRRMALRGFQAVLTHFPDARSYDVTGTISYELVTESYLAILALGGTAEGWILVATPSGGQRAVKVED